MISGVDCMFLNPHLCIHDGITLCFRVGPSNSFGSSTDFLHRKKLICVQKNDFFGPKSIFFGMASHYFYIKKAFFCASTVEIWTPGWLLGPKKKHFWLKKGNFLAFGHGEVMIPLCRSVWGQIIKLYWRSIKKTVFGPWMQFFGPKSFFLQQHPIFLSPTVNEC